MKQKFIICLILLTSSLSFIYAAKKTDAHQPTAVITSENSVMELKLIKKNRYSISKIKAIGVLHIPPAYDGLPITSICSDAFAGCSGLTAVTIPNTLTTIEQRAFMACIGLTQVIISNGLGAIGNAMFFGCTALTDIIIPASVTNLGEFSFNGCIKLKHISLPIHLITIGKYAFSGCYSLTSIKIPDTVTSIDDGAFFTCIKLTNVQVSSSPPPQIGRKTLDSTSSNLLIHVPTMEASVEYQGTRDWDKYSAKIVYP